jgi:HK97 family phage prohead protease
MSNVERRYTRKASKVELKARSDGAPPTICGYAAVFYDANDEGTEYQLYDDLVERIMPGAFTRALREDDVRGMFNHDDNLILGRTGAGTMRLSIDSKGLRYEIDPPDTQVARDLITLLQRGDVTGSSFSFNPRSTTTRKDGDGLYVLERNDLQLFDVGPVAFPAYKSTEAGARNDGERSESARREVDEWERSQKPSPVSRDPIQARAAAVAVMLAD